MASTRNRSGTSSHEKGEAGSRELSRHDGAPAKAAQAGPAARPPRDGPGATRMSVGVVVGIALALAAVSLVVAAGFRDVRREPQVAPVPIARAVSVTRGVTDSEIVLGMAAPLYETSREMGEGVKAGLELAFAAANEGGGVNGRKIRLVALDDADEPEKSLKAVRELVEERGALAVIGAGTISAAAPLAYVNEKKVVYFGVLSGLPALRKQPPDRYVFSFRPSIADEVRAAVRYLTVTRHIPFEKIAVFAQDDAFGDAGFTAVADLAREQGRDPAKILRVGYRRNTVDVDAAVSRLRAERGEVRALVMVATAQPSARLIRRAKASGLDLVYAHLSAVNGAELAEHLRETKTVMRDDVVVMQIVPLPQSRDSAVVKYRQLLEKASTAEAPSSVSLEGYVVGTLLVDAVRRVGRALDSESLVRALESTQALDIGIGSKVGFGPRNHQASQRVWCAMLDGSYRYKSIE